jgi:hypothetical protein
MTRTIYKGLVVCAAAGILCLTAGGTAGATNYAGLVVQHGDGSVVSRCVAFEEPSISGIELLFRSGLSVDAPTSGYGASVFGIDGEGTAADWSSGRASWAYWHLRGGWVFSPVGASSYQVKQGDVEGWAWGSQTSPVSPPIITFDQLYREAYGEPQAPAPSGGGSTSAPTGGTAAQSPASTAASPAAQTSAPVGKNDAAKSSKIATAAGTRDIATATARAGSRSTAVRRPVNIRDYLLFALLLVCLSTAYAYFSLRKNRSRSSQFHI